MRYFNKRSKEKPLSAGFDAVFLLETATLSAFLCLYVVGILWLTDMSLAQLLPGYKFSGSYGLGIVNFYISIMIFIYWTRWRRRTSWRYYALGSLAIFFPLVFISSALTILFIPENALVLYFSDQYCTAKDATPTCGRAFAAIIFSMSLRALPTVLTIPTLCWYLLIHHTSFVRRSDE